MDILIIGAGFSGAIMAQEMAKKGKKVFVYEKRDHIGGNCYDGQIEDVLVHRYGPHIFHTNNEKVYKYMQSFWTLNDYKNRVLGEVKGKIIPIPFNFSGIDKFFLKDSQEIKTKLTEQFGKDSRIVIMDLLKSSDPLILEVANFIYENIFKNYTEKMWGMPIEKIDKFVLQRVPVIIGYKDRYFSDKYEGLPKYGYSNAINKLLTHKNITVKTNVNALDILELKDQKVFMDNNEIMCPIIYTGSIDELLKYKHGQLPYRSLNIEFELSNNDRLQMAAVINRPGHPKITRTTEYKIMTGQKIKGKTVISTEEPGDFEEQSNKFGIRYYPLSDLKSIDLYKKYLDEIKNYPHIIPLGRLARYKYLNMDQIIAEALELAETIE